MPLRLLCIIACAFAVSASAGEKEWREHFDAGKSALESRNGPLAQTRLRQALAEAEAMGPEHARVALTANELALAIRFHVPIPSDQLSRSRELLDAADREAERLFLRSIAIYERGGNGASVATVSANLADLYSSQTRWPEAEALYLKALRLREGLFGVESIAVGEALTKLGSFSELRGRHADAEAHYLRAYSIAERHLPSGDLRRAVPLDRLINLYGFVLHRFDKSDPLVRTRLALHRQASVSPDVLLNALEHAAAYFRYPRIAYGEAEPLTREALALAEKLHGPSHWRYTNLCASLATIVLRQGRFAEAEQLMKRVLEVDKEATAVMDSLGDLYYYLGRYDEVESLWRRAMSAIPPYSLDMATMHHRFGALYREQGRFAEAEASWKEAF